MNENNLQFEVTSIEGEQADLVKQRTYEITEKYRKMGQLPPDTEITQSIAHECVLREICSTLAHRKKLHAQVGHLQNEILQLERSQEDKKVIAPVPVATVKPHSVSTKPRKSREHRSRSQEWPDVPDIGKIEEQNPEILAQKILETGRQIEASKHSKPNVIVNGYLREPDRHIDYNRKVATIQRSQRPSINPPPLAHRQSPVKPQKPLNVVAKVQESPKVINFEDRLKSIITSVLNEDQEQRKQTTRPPTYTNGYTRPQPYNRPHQHPSHSQIQQSQQHTRSVPSHHNQSVQSSHSTHSHSSHGHSSHGHSSHGHGSHGHSAHGHASHSQGSHSHGSHSQGSSSHGSHNQPHSAHHHGSHSHGSHSHGSHGYGMSRDTYRRDRYPYDPSRRPLPTDHRDRQPVHGMQPDYTQVSPAKLALRRHLSQERLAAGGARTIGDLVNGEIERTLEISNQSIINAAVAMSARYPHEPPASSQGHSQQQAHPPLEGLAACLQARVLASEYWRGSNAGGNGSGEGERERRRSPPPADPHSNTSTPLVDEIPDPHRPQESEAGEEVEESKWTDRIAFRFDQIISFASTAIDEKRRRSDEACNTSPDSGIGHGEAGTALAHAPPTQHPVDVALELAGQPRTPSPLPEPSHHFKKRFFRRERWPAWPSGAHWPADPPPPPPAHT